MSHRTQESARVIAESSREAIPKPERPAPKPKRASGELLTSPAALDMLWWFRRRAAEMGFHAGSLEGGGGSYSESASRKHDQQMTPRRAEALAEERRIGAALRQVPPHLVEILRVAYEMRQRDVETHRALGSMADVAWFLPVAREAHAKYAATAHEPYSFDLWLNRAARTGAPIIGPIRDQLEIWVQTALAAYDAVRTQPAEAPRAPRRSPALTPRAWDVPAFGGV